MVENKHESLKNIQNILSWEKPSKYHVCLIFPQFSMSDH